MTRQYYRQDKLKGYDDRKCLNCGSDKTYIHKDGRKQWHVYLDGYLCKKCYNNLILNPKLNRINNDRWNSVSIIFLKLHIFLSFNPRKGICSWCGKKKGEKFTTKKGSMGTILTHMHHWFYLPIMPWACTEEICNQCHGIHHNGKF